MSWLHSDSFDHYTDVTMKYSSDSTAVITPGAGRKGTAGIVTNGTTFFTLDRVAINQPIETLTLIRGIAMEILSLPAATQTIMQFQEADDTDQICIGLLSTGIVRVFRGDTAGTVLASSPFPLSVGVSYFIEVKVFSDDAAGTVEVRIWNALDRSFGTATILDTEDTVTAPSGMFTASDLGRKISFSTFESHIIAVNSPTEVQVADSNTTGGDISGTGTLSYIPAIDFTGDTQNAGTGTLGKILHGLGLSASWDDGYLCDTEGAAFNDFLGNKHIEVRRPNGAGFYTNWAPVPPGSPNWANSNDSSPDGDATYNYAPIAGPVEFPSFRSVESTTDSDTCPVPADAEIGDLLFAVVRNTAASIIAPLPNVNMAPFMGLPGLHAGFAVNFARSSGAPSLTTWSAQIAHRVVDGTEPASYTFESIFGGPAIGTRECVILCFTGVNQAVPVEDTSGTASPIRQVAVNFIQVDALTDNDLIIAFEMTESQTPTSPSGYTPNHEGGLVNVSSRVKASAGGEIPPSTTLAGIDTWGTRAFSVKAQAQIEAGDKDTFATQDTMAPTVDGVMVNLCTRVDEASHTVGAVMRQDGIDVISEGVAPTSDYLIYQFPFEAAPDAGAWSPAKYNESESGYVLDSEEPPPPPEEAVIFWVDADDLDIVFNDGDPITSITETGIHGYTLTLARPVAGHFIAQTFQTGVGAVNNQDSIEGFTQSLSCTPDTSSIGYTNPATNSDLWLPNAFTLICVFNLTQFDGCWEFGDPVIITRRGADAGADFAGWILTCARDGAGDPGASGKVIFYRFDSVLTPLCTVNSANNSILENQTYIVTVICDGVTLRMRVDGVEVSSTAYVVDTEPAASDLWFLTNGSQDPDVSYSPQGQVPFTKIWSFELDGAILAAEEAALSAKYQ